METVVYVDRPGSLLRSRGDRLVVERGDEVLFRLNLRRIRQVVCFGRVGMTTPFLHRALRDGIDIVLLDEHGGTGGRLSSLAHSDPTARRAQYRLADDQPAARELARAFVDGKIANMRVALLRAGRRVPASSRTAACESLAMTRLLLTKAQSVDELIRFDDFTNDAGAGCRMVARARQAFLAAYERRMLTLFTHEPSGRRVSYRVVLGLQARALARAIIDPDRAYRHYRSG
ncbi:MAG TPA: CRISPR-associated endonuclease Cas1 [Streptosporangiaceae bacterium]|nr:CRISPR-associated endonuclease Cas1 [Streptosporangiaceae bacterium]